MAIQGTVTLTGPIAPTSTGDTYPVFDSVYGLDGLRNVNTLTDRNNIPDDRRRAGMLVGVSGVSGTEYYTLLKGPWTGTDSDWIKLNTGGNTITGFTFNPSNYDISIGIEDTTSYTQNLGILATDVTITSGSYNPTNGVVTFSSNTTNSLTGLNYLGNWSPLSSYTANDAVTYAGNGLDYFTLSTSFGPSATPPSGDTAHWIPLSQRNVINVSGFTTGYTNTNIYNSDGTLSGGNRTVQLSAYTLEFKSGNTSVLSMNSGNIGINTYSPSYKLEVSGTGRYSGLLAAQGDLYVGAAGSSQFDINTLSSSLPYSLGIWRKTGNGNYTYLKEDEQGGAKHKWAFVRRDGFDKTRTFFQIGSSIINVNMGWSTPSDSNYDASSILIDPVIDITGRTGTKVRGVYYNPTISALTGTTHIAWENTTGTAFFGTTSGNVTIGAAIDSGNKLYVYGSSDPVKISGLTQTAATDVNILTSDSNGVVHAFTGSTNRIPFFDNTGKVTTSSQFLYSQGATPNNTSATLSLPSGTGAIDFGVGRVQIYSPGAPNGLILEAAAGQGSLGTYTQYPDTSKYFWFRNKTNNTYLYMANYPSIAKFNYLGYVQFSAPYAKFGGQVVVNSPSTIGSPNPFRDFWGTAGAGFDVRGVVYTEASTNTITPATRGDIVANSFQTPTFSASTTIILSTQNYTTTTNYLMYYSASTAGVIQSVTINDSVLNAFKNASLFTLPSLGTSPVGTVSTLRETLSATSTGYRGISYSQVVAQTGATYAGFFTGITTGSTVYYTGVTSAVTYNSLSNVYIDNAPFKSTNVFGDTFALRVNSGSTYLGENLIVNGAGGSRYLSSWLTSGPSFRVEGTTFIDTTSSIFAQPTAFNTFGTPTLDALSPTVYGQVSNVYIAGPPQFGVNASIDEQATAPYSLRIEQGSSNFGGRLVVWPYIPPYGRMIPIMPSDNRTEGLIFSVGKGAGLIDNYYTDTSIVNDPIYLTTFSKENIVSSVGTVSTPIKYQSVSTVYIEGEPDLDESVSAQTRYPLYISSGTSHMGYGFSVSLSNPYTMAGKVTLPATSPNNRILVSNPLVTTDSIVMLTRQGTSGAYGNLYVTVSSGQFYIWSTSTADNGTVGYMIINRED